MHRVVERLAVTVNLGSEADHHVESIDCVVKSVQGPVATVTPRGPIRRHVRDRLTRGAGGFLVLEDDDGLTALRGMALAVEDSADLTFVVPDADDAVPYRRRPSAHENGDDHITNGVRVLYVSQAKADLSEADFTQILAVARVKNREAGLTGALCYRAGFFAQVLEGPEPAIRECYDRISRDDRHSDPVIVGDEPATQRLYTGWLMKGIDNESTITAADELIALKGLSDRDDAPQLTRRWLGLLNSQSSPAWRSDWLAAKQSVLLIRELVERSAQPIPT